MHGIRQHISLRRRCSDRRVQLSDDLIEAVHVVVEQKDDVRVRGRGGRRAGHLEAAVHEEKNGPKVRGAMKLRASDRQTADARDLFDDRLHSVSLLLFEQRRDVRGGPLGVAVVGRRAVSAARALRPPRRQVAAIAAAAAAGITLSRALRLQLQG